MTSITLLLAFPVGETWTWAGLALLYVAAGLTLWSMILYLRAAWPDLFPRKFPD
jgi:CDP-diacylglycerol--glycerol-3-phosphate 3-phosphatidyltransferase